MRPLQVGSGVVTANLLGTIPVPTQVTFDLVRPPAPGDLAGLAVNSSGTQIGSTVNLLVNSATFTGLPDIPLTNLTVSLAGGAQGLYLTTCRTPTGTATARLTDQNGDRTVTVASAFTVSGCPSTGAGAGRGGARKRGGASRRGIAAAGRSLTGAGMARLMTRRASAHACCAPPRARRT